MPKVTMYRMDGTPSGEVELSETVFAAPVNPSVMHEVVVAHLANKRQGTQSALTRAEVRGGGIKPFRQKGTGRARQGSSRSPQYEGGGVVFAPKPRDYSKKVNKKVRQAALRSALSSKVADEDIIGEPDLNVARSASNIPGVSVAATRSRKKDDSKQEIMSPSVYDILGHEKLILTQDALNALEEGLGNPEEGAGE